MTRCAAEAPRRKSSAPLRASAVGSGAWHVTRNMSLRWGDATQATKTVGHPLHPMLVAFPVTFYTSTLAGLRRSTPARRTRSGGRSGSGSNAAGLLTTLLAAPRPLRRRARALSCRHFALFAFNLCAHFDCWTVGPHNGLARPLRSGEVQVLVLPDAGLRAGAHGARLAADVAGWARVTPRSWRTCLQRPQVRARNNLRLEVRPSRPLIQT